MARMGNKKMAARVARWLSARLSGQPKRLRRLARDVAHLFERADPCARSVCRFQEDMRKELRVVALTGWEGWNTRTSQCDWLQHPPAKEGGLKERTESEKDRFFTLSSDQIKTLLFLLFCWLDKNFTSEHQHTELKLNENTADPWLGTNWPTRGTARRLHWFLFSVLHWKWMSAPSHNNLLTWCQNHFMLPLNRNIKPGRLPCSEEHSTGSLGKLYKQFSIVHVTGEAHAHTQHHCGSVQRCYTGYADPWEE